MGPGEPPLGPIRYRRGDYTSFHAAMLRRLATVRVPGTELPPLAELIPDQADWIVALCDVWARVADVVTFYQERIINEAFLPTATSDDARTHLYHSVGHSFPPNLAASTVLSYTVDDKASGVEAVGRLRARRAAGSGGPASDGAGPPTAPRRSVVPAHAQVRAVPKTSDTLPPVFATTEALDALAGASRVTLQVPKDADPPPVTAATTQLELDGLATGVAVGAPVVVAGRDPASGGDRRWVRFLVSVKEDAKRGSTLIAWSDPLDPAGDPAAGPVVADPVVYRFAQSAALFAHDAAPWSTLPLASQLAAAGPTGDPVVGRGGVQASGAPGATWQDRSTGLPPDARPASLHVTADLVLVGCEKRGLYVASGGGPFGEPSGTAPRGAVLFVGGSADRLLAGTSLGDVYQSVDGGQNWDAVNGGPPTLEPAAAPDASGATATSDARQARGGKGRGSSGGSDSAGRQVVMHRLPGAAVRCVMEHGDGLFAGTDKGLWAFDGTNWSAESLTLPVFSLTESPSGDLLAATSKGVAARGGDGSWNPVGSGLAGPVHALAALPEGKPMFAATDKGLWSLIEPTGTWLKVPASGPGALAAASAPVAVAATTTAVTVGTAADGIWRSTDGGATWARCDEQWLFSLPGATLGLPAPVPAPAGGAAPTAPPSSIPVPPGLASAFSDRGLPLSGDISLAPEGPGFVLQGAPAAFRLTPTAGGAWNVTATGALPKVAALAGAPAGDTVMAASGDRGVWATEWPGFGVHGTEIDLARRIPVGLAPASLVLVVSRTGPVPHTALFDVASVEQRRAARFGESGDVTSVVLSGDVAPGVFDRRTSTVWFGSALVAPYRPPPATVPHASGATLALSAPVAGIAPGRRAVVTGSPISLTVAPLGGVVRIRGGKADLLGLQQATVQDVVAGPAGWVYAASPEGVFGLAPGTGDPSPAGTGLPPGGAVALGIAGPPDARVVLAGTSTGLYRSQHPVGVVSAWERAGLPGEPIVALAGDGLHTVVAAGATGSVYRTDDAGSPAPSWQPLPPLDSAAVCLVLAGGGVLAATKDGVFRLRAASPGPVGSGSLGSGSLGSGSLGSGSLGSGSGSSAGTATGWVAVGGLTGVTCLAAEPEGSLWATSAAGLFSFTAAGGWRPDPALGLAGTPLCVAFDAVGALVGGTGAGLFRRVAQGLRWDRLPGDVPGAPVALRRDPSGAVTLAGVSTSLPIVTGQPGPAAALTQDLVFLSKVLGGLDLAALDQGAIPDLVAAGFAANGGGLDRSSAVVSVLQPGRCWLVVAGHDVFVLGVRTTVSGQAVAVYRNTAMAQALGTPASAGGMEVWPVVLGGVRGTLQAKAGTVVRLPAAAGAAPLAETVRVAGVANRSGSVGAAPASLSVDPPLTNVYDASTVAVHLNVVPALQGRRVTRILGSGDPATPFQTFTIPARIAFLQPDGAPAVSSLAIEVDGARWSDGILDKVAGTDRVYQAEYGADGAAHIRFGDGVHGSLLPAGHNNVVATYLEGGGPEGEADAGEVLQLLDRPLLVAAVHNPVPARLPPVAPRDRSIVAAVRTFGRVVALEDVEEVATAQPGVAAAAAQLLAHPGGREIVLTVAPAPDAPDDLVPALEETLARGRGPGLRIRVLPAAIVPVDLSLHVVAPRQDAQASLRAAIDRFGSPKPGMAMLASLVVRKALTATGVTAVTITGWNRPGQPLRRRPRIDAARARWQRGRATPDPAEYLVIDGSAAHCRIDLQMTGKGPRA